MKEPDVELLSVAQMGRADALTIASGIPGTQLMARAGQSVFDALVTRWSVRPVLVLCGPGNNGGDGFVVARLLARAGWPVQVALFGQVSRLKGDALWAAQDWLAHCRGRGLSEPQAVLPWADLTPALIAQVGLVVDAVFGAGLARALPADCVAVFNQVRQTGVPVVAIDVPSGVWGDSGWSDPEPQGALAADLTVTFFRKKPAHWLYPGRALCGWTVVADIGIAPAVLPELAVQTFENTPELWRSSWPGHGAQAHKYQRGHAVVVGGARMTGAARLAAKAAARIGAGLTTVAAPQVAWPVYAASLDCIMVHAIQGHSARAQADDLAEWLTDPRLSSVLIGPGAGAEVRQAVLAVLRSGRNVVLDADALTAFQDRSAELFEAISRADAQVVLTPHEGEFQRLFGRVLPQDQGLEQDKLARARWAAQHSGAVVLLKGADTVVAAPDGRAAINGNAPHWLGTAGAGDVLAGIITGLLAQGMPAWEAACAAAWVHGEAARLFGPGLIADDLPEQLPAVLRQLHGWA